MKNKNKNSADNEAKTVLQELRVNPYRYLGIIFALIAVLPLLSCVYILTVRLFSIDILTGDIGLILTLSIVLIVCGSYLGYWMIRDILKRLISYAAREKQQNKLKSQFIATISHDFRSPLNAILGNIQLLQMNETVSLNEDQKEHCGVCIKMINRMTRMVNDLLDIYKIESGMVRLNSKMSDLVDLVEQQIKEFNVMLNEKNIQVKKEFSGEKISVWADADMMMEVINNLLGNAVKYTSEGGKITLRISPVDDFIKVEIANDGPGIAEDKLTKIFDKFEQQDSKKDGSGLGLAIAKDIVELHKGRIWAESRQDKGSKFIFTIPKGKE